MSSTTTASASATAPNANNAAAVDEWFIASADDEKQRQEDLEALRQENEALRKALMTLQSNMQAQKQAEKLQRGTPRAGSQSDNATTSTTAEKPTPTGAIVASTSTDNSGRAQLIESLNSPEGTNDLLARLQKRVESDDFLARLESSRAVLVAKNADRDDEVGVVDLNDITWWTVVPVEEDTDKCEPCPLDGSYVFVEQHDVVDAIAEMVALYVAQNPNMQKLSPEEFQQMLAGTCQELREKGPVRRMWDWGKFLYTTYGWTSTAVSLYRDPALVRWMLKVIWTVSKWAVMFAV